MQPTPSTTNFTLPRSFWIHHQKCSLQLSFFLLVYLVYIATWWPRRRTIRYKVISRHVPNDSYIFGGTPLKGARDSWGLCGLVHWKGGKVKWLFWDVWILKISLDTTSKRTSVIDMHCCEIVLHHTNICKFVHVLDLHTSLTDARWSLRIHVLVVRDPKLSWWDSNGINVYST